jgi:hypothetical protein
VRALLQLGRFGDILNILPVALQLAHEQKKPIDFCVAAEFASILEGVNYARAIPLQLNFSQTGAATNQLRARGYREIINTQLYRTDQPCVPATTESFLTDSYKLAGKLPLFRTAPLVFDNRDHNRELKLVEKFGVSYNTLLVSLLGFSSPFPGASALFDKIARRWGGPTLAIGSIRAHRIYDLLGLFDVAAGAILSDSAPLHLATCGGMPVGAIIADSPTLWHGSIPRCRVVSSVRYSRAARAIEGVVEGVSKDNCKPRIHHVYSWHHMPDDLHRRHRAARVTWSNLYRSGEVSPLPFLDRDMKRSGKNLGDAPLPFIKDIFNWACARVGRDDIILFTNSDICLDPGIVRDIKTSVSKFGCYYGHRVDVRDARVKPDLNTAHTYCGADVFAFQPVWWNTAVQNWPDLLLGREGWDAVMKIMMQETGFRALRPKCWHEAHASVFGGNQIHTLRGQVHNRAVTYAWMRQNKHGNYLLCRPEDSKPLVKEF